MDALVFKRLGLRCIWLLELGLFGYGYFFNSDNRNKIRYYAADIERQKQQIEREQSQIMKLKYRVNRWQQEPWLLEKQARDVLRLGTPDEEQYIIDE